MYNPYKARPVGKPLIVIMWIISDSRVVLCGQYFFH
jgi:hypothetical protein